MKRSFLRYLPFKSRGKNNEICIFKEEEFTVSKPLWLCFVPSSVFSEELGLSAGCNSRCETATMIPTGVSEGEAPFFFSEHHVADKHSQHYRVFLELLAVGALPHS